MYFVNRNITQHVLQNELENEKSHLCYFTWIVFIELNFTVAFMLIRKTWDGEGMACFQKWGDPSNGEIILKQGGGEGADTPLRTLSKR